MLEGVQMAETSSFCPGVRVGLGRVKAAEGSGSFSKWLDSGLPVKVWRHGLWEQVLQL